MEMITGIVFPGHIHARPSSHTKWLPTGVACHCLSLPPSTRASGNRGSLTVEGRHIIQLLLQLHHHTPLHPEHIHTAHAGPTNSDAQLVLRGLLRLLLLHGLMLLILLHALLLW